MRWRPKGWQSRPRRRCNGATAHGPPRGPRSRKGGRRTRPTSRRSRPRGRQSRQGVGGAAMRRRPTGLAESPRGLAEPPKGRLGGLQTRPKSADPPKEPPGGRRSRRRWRRSRPWVGVAAQGVERVGEAAQAVVRAVQRGCRPSELLARFSDPTRSTLMTSPAPPTARNPRVALGVEGRVEGHLEALPRRQQAEDLKALQARVPGQDADGAERQAASRGPHPEGRGVPSLAQVGRARAGCAALWRPALRARSPTERAEREKDNASCPYD